MQCLQLGPLVVFASAANILFCSFFPRGELEERVSQFRVLFLFHDDDKKKTILLAIHAACCEQKMERTRGNNKQIASCRQISVLCSNSDYYIMLSSVGVQTLIY
jgi:hypothetical protein